MLALLLTTLWLEAPPVLPSSETEGPTPPVSTEERTDEPSAEPAGEVPIQAPDASADAPAEPPAGEPTLPQPPTLPGPPSGGVTPPPSASLRWSAPLGCPSVDELRQGIERRLGRSLDDADVQVDAQIVVQEGGYRLVLQSEAGDVVERRTLDADDCGALTDATALIVALAVDPVAVAGGMELWSTAPESSESATPKNPRRATPTGPPSRSAAVPESSRRLEGGLLRVAGGVGLGAVPGITGAFSLAGGLRWRRARLELEGAYWIPRRSEPVDGASVQIQLGTAAVRGCGVLARDRLEAPLCGGLQLGGMRGAGAGSPNARTAQGLWLAVDAGVGLSWWFRPSLGLAGGFSAAVPVIQPGFEIDEQPPVRLFEPPPVAGRLWLGLEIRIPRRSS